MTRSQGSWDVEVEIPINKWSCQPRRDHEGTVGLVLVGGQVVGMADCSLTAFWKTGQGSALSAHVPTVVTPSLFAMKTGQVM